MKQRRNQTNNWLELSLTYLTFPEKIKKFDAACVANNKWKIELLASRFACVYEHFFSRKRQERTCNFCFHNYIKKHILIGKTSGFSFLLKQQDQVDSRSQGCDVFPRVSSSSESKTQQQKWMWLNLRKASLSLARNFILLEPFKDN